MVTEEYQENLKDKALIEFYKLATTGSEKKFSYDLSSLNPEKDAEFFKHNDSLMAALHEIRTHLKSYFMSSVFSVFSWTAENGLDEDRPQIDLLSHWERSTEEHVGMSNQIWGDYAVSAIHAQNLSWSYEYLLNSCDSTLREDIESRLLAIPAEHKGGPLVFHMIMSSLGFLHPCCSMKHYQPPPDNFGQRLSWRKHHQLLCHLPEHCNASSSQWKPSKGPR